MLIISTFCKAFSEHKMLTINILLRLLVSVYAYTYALVETSLGGGGGSQDFLKGGGQTVSK